MHSAPPVSLRPKCTSIPNRPSAGFTLIELLVAASLIGMILATGATLTMQVSQSRQRLDQLSEHHGVADAALRALVTPLQSLYRAASRDDLVFVGIDNETDGRPADSLTFLTASNRVIRPGHPESDVHEIEFSLESPGGDDRPMLMRRTDPTRNALPDGGGVLEVVARDVVSLDFEYFEAGQWLTDWPEYYGRLPQAMRVSVGIDFPNGQERIYRRLIYWPAMPEDNADGGTTTPTDADLIDAEEQP